MAAAVIPPNESARLAALRDCDVLDSATEQAFDDLTRLASEICETPIALVSLVDEDRQWFKSHHGLEARETPRDVAFCAHAILQQEIFEITDSHRDDRFAENPLVTGAPNIRFYAGAVLTSAEQNIGTLCVIDHEPRELDEHQRRCLRLIAGQVENLLTMRRHLREKKELFEAHTRDRHWIARRREELARFAYRSSHDLRAPAIQIGELARLSEADLAAGNELAVRRNLQMLNEASERLLAFIDGTIDLGRSELIGGTTQPVDFNRLLREAVAEAETMLQQHPVRIRCSVEIDGRFCSEFLRLRQILVQLILNGVRYRDPARRRSWVDVSVALDGDRVRLRVADNGLGIPETLHDQYFDMFRRFHPEVCPGSGVGTAIVRKHADALGATVTLASDTRGTTVDILLPASTTEEMQCTA